MRAYPLASGPPVAESARSHAKPRGTSALACARRRASLSLLSERALAWLRGGSRLARASVAEEKLATAPGLSIVVLPFANLSGDKEQDYFADGITDDLTTDLSHLPDSFVISRGTAFTYKGKEVDAKEIGQRTRRSLRVGRQRAAGRRDDHAQRPAHFDAETGAHVWADRFDGERADLGECRSSSSPA